MKKLQTYSGFTLVELIVVMGIMLLFSLPALQMQKGLTDHAKSKSLIGQFQTIETAIRAQYVYDMQQRRLDPTVSSRLLYSISTAELDTTSIFVFPGTASSMIAAGAGSIGTRFTTDSNTGQVYTAQPFLDQFASLQSISAKLSLDPWKHPIVVVLAPTYIPSASQDASTPFRAITYCPSRDNRSVKIMLLSAGANGVFDNAFVRDGSNESALTFAQYLNTVFVVNSNTYASSWSTNWSARNDDVAYFIDLSDIDSQFIDDTSKHLTAFEALLKNSFFSSFYSEMTTHHYAQHNATEINYFLNTIYTDNLQVPIESFRTLFQLTSAEITDAWGNYLIWDPDVSASVDGIYESSAYDTDPKLYYSVPNKIGGAAGDSADPPNTSPYSSRLFSPCAIDASQSFQDIDVPGTIDSQLKNQLLIKTITGTY